MMSFHFDLWPSSSFLFPFRVSEAILRSVA